jgi:hypothetical protein
MGSIRDQSDQCTRDRARVRSQFHPLTIDQWYAIAPGHEQPDEANV